MTQQSETGRRNGRVGRSRYRSTDWLAGRWDMHPESIRRLIREGKIPATKVNRSWVIAVEDVEAIEEAGRSARSPRPGSEAA